MTTGERELYEVLRTLTPHVGKDGYTDFWADFPEENTFVFVEHKSPKSRLRPSQRRFHEAIRRAAARGATFKVLTLEEGQIPWFSSLLTSRQIRRLSEIQSLLEMDLKSRDAYLSLQERQKVIDALVDEVIQRISRLQRSSSSAQAAVEVEQEAQPMSLENELDADAILARILRKAKSNREKFYGRHRLRKDGSPDEPLGGWWGRWDAGENWRFLAIRNDILRQWLRDMGYPPQTVLEAWRAKGYLRIGVNGGFNYPLRINGRRAWAVCFDRTAIEAMVSNKKAG